MPGIENLTNPTSDLASSKVEALLLEKKRKAAEESGKEKEAKKVERLKKMEELRTELPILKSELEEAEAMAANANNEIAAGLKERKAATEDMKAAKKTAKDEGVYDEIKKEPYAFFGENIDKFQKENRRVKSHQSRLGEDSQKIEDLKEEIRNKEQELKKLEEAPLKEAVAEIEDKYYSLYAEKEQNNKSADEKYKEMNQIGLRQEDGLLENGGDGFGNSLSHCLRVLKGEQTKENKKQYLNDRNLINKALDGVFASLSKEKLEDLDKISKNNYSRNSCDNATKKLLNFSSNPAEEKESGRELQNNYGFDQNKMKAVRDLVTRYKTLKSELVVTEEEIKVSWKKLNELQKEKEEKISEISHAKSKVDEVEKLLTNYEEKKDSIKAALPKIEKEIDLYSTEVLPRLEEKLKKLEDDFKTDLKNSATWLKLTDLGEHPLDDKTTISKIGVVEMSEKSKREDKEKQARILKEKLLVFGRDDKTRAVKGEIGALDEKIKKIIAFKEEFYKKSGQYFDVKKDLAEKNEMLTRAQRDKDWRVVELPKVEKRIEELKSELAAKEEELLSYRAWEKADFNKQG